MFYLAVNKSFLLNGIYAYGSCMMQGAHYLWNKKQKIAHIYMTIRSIMRLVFVMTRSPNRCSSCCGVFELIAAQPNRSKSWTTGAVQESIWKRSSGPDFRLADMTFHPKWWRLHQNGLNQSQTRHIFLPLIFAILKQEINMIWLFAPTDHFNICILWPMLFLIFNAFRNH